MRHLHRFTALAALRLTQKIQSHGSGKCEVYRKRNAACYEADRGMLADDLQIFTSFSASSSAEAFVALSCLE
jgi:hypothetical protein